MYTTHGALKTYLLEAVNVTSLYYKIYKRAGYRVCDEKRYATLISINGIIRIDATTKTSLQRRCEIFDVQMLTHTHKFYWLCLYCEAKSVI